jgi:hypothetical protein
MGKGWKMPNFRNPQLNAIAALLFLTSACASAVKTINGPQGGAISYGRVDGQTTEAGAMGAMLRSLHSQFGDRPQVGKLFQVRGTQSVAAFFSVNRRTQGKGQQAGLIIVTKVTTDDVEGALLSDDAAHLGVSLNPMMKSLFAAWHPFEAAAAGGASGGGLAALHPYTTPDRTASVSLPDGWKPQSWSAQGTIVADGPNGESASLGYGFLAADLNNPRVRQTYATVMHGGLRGTGYANGIYYALSSDLTKDYLDLIRLFRQKNNLPPSTIQVKSSTPVAGPPGQHCAHIQAIGNPQDAKTAAEMDTVFCISTPTPAAGGFGVTLNATSVPVALAPKERATLGAVLASFTVDTAAVQRMASAYAAPAIESIHAIGRAAAAQAAAAHERNEIQNSSVYQHWDSMDRRSKDFSDYLLGFSVVQDNARNTHGTLWNEDADALVKADPQRFEYVTAPGFWKGIDY